MILRKKALCGLLLLPTLLTGPAFGSTVEVRAVRVDSGPRIDGLLTDDAWRAAEPFTGFRMVEPREGADPTEATELRVLYDDHNLYIGLLCRDGEPRRIAANTMAHDSVGSSGGGRWGPGFGHGATAGSSDDLVRLLLDPFQDKRHAYLFYVNALGARSEGLAYNRLSSLDWDGIWEAKSRIVPEGWSAEMRIPFKSISFKPGLGSWGINVERVIPRKAETIRLSGATRDSLFNSPMDAAVLTGLSGIRQGLGVTFRPYGLADSWSGASGSPGRENTLRAGFDIYKNFTPNLVGVASYNMDFAETEADERRINLTRFPLFFPEKRMFFLEGSETFSFSSSVSFIPFFSRRIGLFGGEQVPVRFGAKLFGRLGGTNLAVLDVQTGDVPGLPARNLFAARLTRNVMAESKLGFIVTNGSPAGGRNTLAGVDFNYATSRFAGNKNLFLSAWAAYNWNDVRDGRHHGFGFRGGYPNDLWNIETTYAFYGEALDPGLGFMMRRGITTYYIRAGFQPRPAKSFAGGLVRQFFFQTSLDYYWDLAGNLETRRVELTPLSFRTESGERFQFEVESNHDVLPYDFEVSSGVVLPRGAYDFTSAQLSLDSATHRPVIVEAGYKLGGFYSGRLTEATLGLTVKASGTLNLSFDADFVRVRLPEGNFNENVLQLKADVFLSPDLGLMNYIQYDDVSKQLGWSARLRWQISPGNEIYLVYNKNWERWREPTRRFFPLEDRGVLKVSLSLRP